MRLAFLLLVAALNCAAQSAPPMPGRLVDAGGYHVKGVDTPPVLISQTPISLDLDDDVNFGKLPERDQQAHLWALSVSTRPTADMARECFSEVPAVEHKTAIPVAVVSTLNDSPKYRELQQRLLALSSNSRQFLANHSTHMVIIDQPDVVVRAIAYVVSASSSR